LVTGPNHYNELDAASPDAHPGSKEPGPVKSTPIMNKFAPAGRGLSGDRSPNIRANTAPSMGAGVGYRSAATASQVGGSNSNPAIITETLPYGIASGANWYGSFQATISTTIGCSNLPKTLQRKENIDLFSQPIPYRV
jgi:hypothetical protein